MRGGVGYSDNTYNVTLGGDGVLRGGTAATATVVVDGGAVISCVVNAAGSKYTFATLTMPAAAGSPSTDAIITPIIGPPGGHGFNAIDELGGFYVMTNTTISGTEGSGDFVVDQDFRRVGVVLNPYNYGTAVIATDPSLNALKSMTFSGTPGTFVIDEVITGGTSDAKGLVVAWDATTKILKYIQTQWTGVSTILPYNEVAFAVAEVVTGAGSATGTIASVSYTHLRAHET